MRTVVMVVVAVLMAPSLAHAQEKLPLRVSRGLHVAVIDADSREWQGRLLEVAKDAVTLEIGADTRRFDLTDVKRIDAHGDKVWDGALKGAAFGALMGAIVGGARFAGASALTYALMGVGMDALNSCTHTVYRGPTRAAGVKLSW